MSYPRPLLQLIEAFERFPGIGRKSAERLAFHLLRDDEARKLPRVMERALREIQRCGVCANVADADPCALCADPERDDRLLCVVEEPTHVEAMERAGVYQGRYHVLMGSLNPAEGAEAEMLSLHSLVERLKAGGFEELILATDPDREGEATALCVLEAVESQLPEPPLITRLARGLPAGSALDYLHRGILEDALEGRRPIGRPRSK